MKKYCYHKKLWSSKVKFHGKKRIIGFFNSKEDMLYSFNQFKGKRHVKQ